MLRTNLSTRPFYNDRTIRIGVALGAVLVGVLTVFNAARIVSLTERNRELADRAAAAEARARELRDRAAQTRKTLDRAELTAVHAAAREANLLIARRAFSWTDLFNRFEETLPPDVRIAAVQPQVDDEGRLLVAVTVLSRRVEDLHDFIDRLEKTEAFRGVLSRQDSVEEGDLLRSVIQGYYEPADATPAAGAPGQAAGSGPNRGPQAGVAAR